MEIIKFNRQHLLELIQNFIVFAKIRAEQHWREVLPNEVIVKKINKFLNSEKEFMIYLIIEDNLIEWFLISYIEKEESFYVNNEETSFIKFLYTSKKIRGKGGASLLLNKLIEELKTNHKNIQKIKLTSDTNNPLAIKIYKKWNFNEETIKLEKNIF